VTFISLLLLLAALLPAKTHASIFTDMISMFSGTAGAQTTPAVSPTASLQTMTLPQPAMNIDPTPARGGGTVTIVDDSAVVSQDGPSGTIADIEKPENPTISTYIVQPGDTVSDIAALFNVSQGTILASNNLKKGSPLKVGQKLVILPVTGIPHTVKKGDTLASIAKRYGGSPTEIANYNGVDDATLAVGDEIIVPNGEVPATATVKSSTATGKSTTRKSPSGVFANNPKEPAHNVGARGTSSEVSYYVSPLAPGTYERSQKIHGYNAVDLAPYYKYKNEAIVAAADGDVVVARAGGWNGGYGSYVVISHSNGSQTLYAHMSKVAAYDGQHVVQGQAIGYVGQTGEATGPHVHFEIRTGIRNPF